MKHVLIDNFPGILVEAAPRYPLWGKGLGLQDPNITIQHLWIGRNWLGYVLIDVRNELTNSDKTLLFVLFMLKLYTLCIQTILGFFHDLLGIKGEPNHMFS